MSTNDDLSLLKLLGSLFCAILVWLLGTAILWCVLFLSTHFHVSRWIAFLILGTCLSWALFIFCIVSGKLRKNASIAGGTLYISFLFLFVCPFLMSVALWGLSFGGAIIWALLSYLVDFTGHVYEQLPPF
jgi:hypothetical protein